MSSIDKYIKKEEVEEEPIEEEPVVEEKKEVATKKRIRFKIPEKKKKEPIEEETEPEKEIDYETKKNIIKKYMGETEHRQGRRLKRKEKREFMNLERENFKEKQNTVLILAIIGIFSIFFIYMYVKVEWALVIIIMYGIMVCLPIGMFLGFIVLDPWWRCKILRKTTKRNFGIVFFVSKAQKMVTKIKDFDAGLIWKKTQCWVLTKSAVYQLSKDGEQLIERGVIESDKIISLVDTVPTLFVDLDSMEPLSLIAGNEPISPEEIGSSLKSWADNQLAKALFIRKSLDMYFIIVIIASIAAAGLAYYGTTKIDELGTKVTALKSLVENALRYLPPPT
jgi:hypothetical protein